jgi:hypothetical protein
MNGFLWTATVFASLGIVAPLALCLFAGAAPRQRAEGNGEMIIAFVLFVLLQGIAILFAVVGFLVCLL